ncbi:MAG TPA: TerC family protein [Planctomycetes bacterium]|nr:TerC family protein [Planctomycetota bacterium]
MMDLTWISDPNAWVALGTLTVLEIVLGIDNIIFIAVLAEKLPENQRDLARRLGLLFAMVTRIGLLFCIAWMIQLQEPIIDIYTLSLSGRDLILLCGGLFLLWKGTHEIHDVMEGDENEGSVVGRKVGLGSVLFQIVLLDVVFSLDSVITAVGMADILAVMVLAVVLSVIVMLIFSRSVSRFVSEHPTIRVLALAFLLLIGIALVADGLGHHIPKGYIYFAMGFSAFVEALNLRIRKLRASRRR